MANPGTRTLQLLSLLQSRRYWPGPELAARLEVSPRTLRRDVDRLRDLGYPVEARQGLGGGYQLAAGAVLPPLVLDNDEAVAIGVGLQAAIEAGTVAGIEEPAVRALSKVVQVMPARLRRRIEALAAMTDPVAWRDSASRVDADVLVSVAVACRDAERLQFAYRARRGERSRRQVDPHRLVLLGRRWYLVAWDLSRFDWRTFRLDRLEEPVATGERAVPRRLPGEDAAAFVRSSIESVPQRHQVDVLIDAPAAVVRERIGPWGALEDVSSGGCRFTMTSDTLDWPTLALGNAAADFEVVAPPELVDHLSERATLFARAVNRVGPSRVAPVTAEPPTSSATNGPSSSCSVRSEDDDQQGGPFPSPD
jgi:predicted DNA-binding transcriptional regulator YafY